MNRQTEIIDTCISFCKQYNLGIECTIELYEDICYDLGWDYDTAKDITEVKYDTFTIWTV